MWQLFAAACWMLLLGPLYGYHRKGSTTNPEATMNIVSHTLRGKKIRKRIINLLLDVIWMCSFQQSKLTKSVTPSLFLGMANKSKS